MPQYFDPLILPRVSALPAAASLGRMYVLTTDGHVYQENGTVWDDLSATGAAGSGMALSALTAATAVADANELFINEAGTSKKITAAQLKTYLGASVTVQALTADAIPSLTGTIAVVMTTTAVGVGTYTFQYFIRYISSAVTNGVKFAVNHTGTLSTFTAISRYVSTGGAAATAAATQAGAAATGNIHEAFSTRTKGAAFQTTGSVDVANADMLMIVEGLMIVTASGDLTLGHASELAASSTVKAGTSLILTKIA